MHNDPVNCVDLWGLTASDSSSINYPIRSGETLSQITRDHNYRYATNYTAEEIAALNGISNLDLIYAGDTLKLPVPTTSPYASSGSEKSHDKDRTTAISPETEDQNSIKHLNFGFSLKAAVIVGIGVEVGITLDTDGNIGLYGTIYLGSGVEVGNAGGSNSIVKNLYNMMQGYSTGWNSGDIFSNKGTSVTADGGAGIIGTWDLRNPSSGTGPLNTTGIGGVGVGGGVWWSATGVVPLNN